MVVAVADNQKSHEVKDEPSLVPSFMRRKAIRALPERQSLNDLRTLGRRGPSAGLTLLIGVLLVAVLVGLAIGAWTLWGRSGPGPGLVSVATVPLPTPGVEVSVTRTPPGSAPTVAPVVIPPPPGRQPRDLGTPEASAVATTLPNITRPVEPSVTPLPTFTLFSTAIPPAAQTSPAVSLPALTRPNGPLIRAPRLAGVGLKSIDDLAERLTAAAAPTIPVDAPVFGVSSWTGPRDLSASLQVGWDSTNLYLMARIIDDTFVQDATGILLYQGDSIELQFDADLAGDFTSRSYNDDDWQLSLSPGNLVGPNPQWGWWVYRGNPGSGSIQILSALQPDGYHLAASIPWSLLRVTPKPGATYGFALNINDNDTLGTKQQESMVSTSPVRQLNDPTSWGTLLLTEPLR